MSISIVACPANCVGCTLDGETGTTVCQTCGGGFGLLGGICTGDQKEKKIDDVLK